MNKNMHLGVSIILITGLFGLQSIGNSFEKKTETKTPSSTNWDTSFIPMWSQDLLRGENFQFGPILIMIISILCAYIFLLYNHNKEELRHEY